MKKNEYITAAMIQELALKARQQISLGKNKNDVRVQMMIPETDNRFGLMAIHSGSFFSNHFRIKLCPTYGFSNCEDWGSAYDDAAILIGENANIPAALLNNTVNTLMG